MSFRVSPEEWVDIERLVRLSGMSKQDYIIHRLHEKEINVTANPRVVKAMKNELRAVVEVSTARKLDDDERSFLDTIMARVDTH